MQSRLEQELEPCANRRHIEAAVNRLLNGFDIGNGPSDENAATLNAEFVEACTKAGLPLAAVVGAADRIRSATTLIPRPNHRFRPMPPEFVAEAREGMVPVRTKLLRVRRILAAEVYDPPTAEQRAEVEKARKAAAEYLTRRMPQANARPVLAEPNEGSRTGADIVAPLKGLDVSHLMASLDRKRVQA